MMNRRSFLCGITLGTLSVPVGGETQQPGRVYRVGVLVYGPPSTFEELAQSPFRNTLGELGWVEGRNIAFEHRFSGEVEPLNSLAAELVRLKVDVIFATGTPAVRVAKQTTSTIPIVMIVGIDPVLGGLVASLPRPGGNITGVTYTTTELWGKRLELIKEAIPAVSRVAYMWNPTNPGAILGLSEVTRIASPLGIRVQSLPTRRADDFDSAFAAMKTEHADALLVATDPVMFTHRARLADLAAKHRMPAVYSLRGHADAGGLIVYSADLTDSPRRAAYFVDKILKGAKPADLPIEQPTKFELIINLKTAKALGLTIPPSLLLRADQVIE